MKKFFTITVVGAIIGVLSIAIAFFTTSRCAGSCGYDQLEYELTFKDAAGNPVEGVELKVEDESGNEFFCFPVTDFLPGNAPKSDNQGLMRFHHVSTMVEWDICWYSIGPINIQSTGSPVYICRFLHAGKEVYRVPYGELPSWDWPGQGWQEVPKVKRQWDWSAMIPDAITFQPHDTEESYYSRLGRFFHKEDNAKPKREAVIAWRNSVRLAEAFEERRRNKQDPVEDLEFPVIRRTIAVKLPKHGG